MKRRHVSGHLLTCLALTALALALLPLNDGIWQWNLHPARIAWAAASTVVFALAWFIGARVRRRRRASTGQAWDSTDALPVFFASQTGYAQSLAEQTAESLGAAGVPARAVPLDQASAEMLGNLSHALFIASTAGEGDPPDTVARFVRHVLSQPLPLSGLRYGLLALGDRHYANFCAFGQNLDTWLRQQGARALFSRIDVDNADPDALARWQASLVGLTDGNDVPVWQTPPFRAWRLARRVELNPGSLGEPVFHLELVPTDGTMPAWRAGDIAEIQPRNGAAALTRWLQDTGLNGNVDVGGDTLLERLARSELPHPAEIAGQDEQQVGAALRELQARDYSIASLPADGHLDLLIRQGHRPDGSPGLAAGWLTAYAHVGDDIAVRVRANPNFHAPEPDVPLILIGNGTGLAGLRALLRERIAQARTRNWLVFGERQRACDFLHGDELDAALAQGQLAHLDLAFSRDTPQRVYVQHRLIEHASRLRAWIDAGAMIHVCGSQAGMAGGVDAALRDILGNDCVQQLIESGRYRRDVY
ncbi:sulfite reductase flavoprotein subunit alpha [Xanthomonadaceae bacterium JHOS43]|nr:sulfite reductase flavoprotein subunit alpha [Xanthomonadaceae bacterium JHOS43]